MTCVMPVILLWALAQRFRNAARSPAWSMRTWCGGIRVALTALAGLAALAGCRNPQAERRLAEREASLRWTAHAWADREQPAPQRLRADAEFMRNNIDRDARLLDRDVRAFRAYLEYDLRRFQERQPEYRRKIDEILRGQPEHIERTAIIMFL